MSTKDVNEKQAAREELYRELDGLPGLKPGQKLLGRYEIKKDIAVGGQGRVYLAYDLVLDVDVVIKELKHGDPDSRKKFEKEVKTLRALHSTNIVRTYDFFTNGESEYIGMEYVKGMDLAKLIKKQEGLPIPLAMHIFRQVCQGLYDAHRKNIIHRDIKPRNVLVSKEGDVLLADFGLAGKVEDFTKEASAYGSIHFMAPEQLDGKKIMGDQKCDIYSIGATLYTILFGETPFLGDPDNGELKSNIIKHDYKKPADRDPDIPAAVNELIVSMLEKDREKRPDIEGVIASVEEYERSLTSGIRSVLQDALKVSIASEENKLDYHNLKLQNGFVTDLCSPASLYTKSCSVQLSVDVGDIVRNASSKTILKISSHLYALIFKADDMGFHFQNAIELSNALRHTEYQSGFQYFEPGEYLARVDFGDHTYLKRFNLQSGQQVKLLSIIFDYGGISLCIHAFDQENGNDITELAKFEKKEENGRWIQTEPYMRWYRRYTAHRFRASCEGYESNEFYLPLETGCYPGSIQMEIPLSQKNGGTDRDIGDKDFDIAGGVLQKYRGSASSVTIPDGVTEIADGAFRCCSSLTSVIIPMSVTEIGDYAFQNCNIRELSHPCLTIQGGLAIKWNSPKDCKLLYCASQAANITIPDAITAIGDGAFSGCTTLVSVCIPNTVAAIGNGAFNGCTSLASVIIPDGIKEISAKAFAGCTSLVSVTIPESVTEICEDAFRGCTSLAPVNIPKSVKTIGKEAFADCTSFSSVCLPEGMEEIGRDVFRGCMALASVTIPDSMRKIGDGAFSGCTTLASVTIPEGVTRIGDGVFSVCTTLASVTIPEGVTRIDQGVFRGCTSLASVTIPDSVEVICDGAFRGCTSLASVTIPDSVTEIGNGAFEGCTSLASVTIPDSVTEIGNGAFEGCTSLASVTIPDSVTKIVNGAFYGCTSLASVSISEGVKVIDYWAFDGCTSLASVTIPDSVEVICDGAFRGCTSLASVTIPDSVEEIGRNAFSGCNIGELSHPCLSIRGGLVIENGTLLYCASQDADITIPVGVTKICEDAFRGCTSLASVTIPGSVTEIGRRVFEGCTSLVSVTIPGSVTEIGRRVFEGCTSLASVSISEGVKVIDYSAFSGCSSLVSVTIPDSVTEIGERAFEGCTSLASVTIPEGGTRIGPGVFRGCNIGELSHPCLSIRDGLVIENGTLLYCASQDADITIPVGVTKICEDVFRGCTSLASVTIPDSVTEIGRSAFNGCTSLASVTIPDSVTEIGEHAFRGCNIGELSHPCLTIRGGLAIKDGMLLYCASQDTDITIPEGVTEIGGHAFDGCTSLASVTIPGSVTGIGRWAFSGCTSLTEIHYAGSKEQWAAVEKDRYWNKGVPAKSVICTDGEVAL